MSFFFGGGGQKVKPSYTGLATQTSTSALPVTIAWGENRIAPNIIWQGDFQAHKQKQKVGKGFGGSVTSYTYSGSFEVALCRGEIHDVVRVWKDQSKETNYAKLGFSLFKGTTPQTPWGYLTSAHPTEALGYPGIAYMAVQNYDLESSNSLPQHSFQVQSLRYATGYGPAGANHDADPALVISDYLSDPGFGVGFDMSIISSGSLFSTGAATTTGDSAFQTYCRAIGFAMSPMLQSQQQASETLQRWLDLCNTAPVWTGYSLKFHPRGADTITANGVTYLPDFPVRYTLTDKDFIYEGNDPIQFDRTDPNDCYSKFTIIIANKNNEFNDLPVSWVDQGLIDQNNGIPRTKDNLEAKDITDPDMAAIMVGLMGQRTAYIRNTFKFKVGPQYALLEPMDIVTCVDKVIGSFNVLITEITENDQNEFEIVAEEWPSSVSSSAPALASQAVTNTPLDTNSAAGSVNPPILLEPPSTLAGGKAQVWAAVSGGDGTTANSNWGGCFVWISTDNVTFNQIGEIDTPARMGKLTATLATYGGANPDTGHTLAVDLSMSAGELSNAASASDAEAGVTVSYVDGEFLSYENTLLTSTSHYSLNNLWRGQYDSTIGSHAIGSAFARLDNNIFKYDLPADYIGKTLYFKFQSFNIFNGAVEDISTCTVYTYSPTGAGYGSGTAGVPAQPTNLTGTGGKEIANLNWTANNARDNVTSYKIFRAAGPGGSFGSAVQVGQVNALSFVDTGLSASTTYTYFIEACNVIGASLPSTGVDITTADTAILGPIYVPATFLPGEQQSYLAPVAYLYHKVGEPCKVRANLAGWQFGATANATASTVFTVKKALAATPNTFTTIGTITIAAGTITPTFATVSGLAYNLAAGDELYIVGPNTNDITLANVHITALLDRTG